MCAPFHEVIEAAGQCEHIVSSALHGLVLADALEIPNRWLWVDDADRDLLGKPEFKYRDYYSAFGMADMPYTRLTGEDSLDTILPRIFPYSRPGLGHLQRGLVETLPFRR